MEHNDTYKTLSRPSTEIVFKEKNSKFYGYAYPISTEAEVRTHIDKLRKQHHGAVHFCYAWQIGTDKISFRANDDGEPGNSAGMPIYGQIQSFRLTNVLVVVVRFFGGVKLGVGGLMAAYKTAAQMALEVSDSVERTIDIHYMIRFDYKDMNKVMRIIKEKSLDIISQQMELDCQIEIAIRKSKSEAIFDSFNNVFGVTVAEKEIP